MAPIMINILFVGISRNQPEQMVCAMKENTQTVPQKPQNVFVFFKEMNKKTKANQARKERLALQGIGQERP